MARPFRVKPNPLVVVLSIIFLICAIAGIGGGVACLFFPSYVPYDLWQFLSLKATESVIYEGVFLGVTGLLSLIGAISGFNGKFGSGRWALGFLIAFSCYACIVNLVGGFPHLAIMQAVIGIVCPALWFFGTYRSEEAVNAR